MTDGPRPSPDPDPTLDAAPASDPTPAFGPEPSADGETEPGPEPPVEPGPLHPSGPSVESTRRLLGASFDLLTRTSEDMRLASFYIGVIVVGTIGPFALASWALEVISVHRTEAAYRDLVLSPGYGWYVVLESLAGAGLVVATVESRVMAAAVLGGHLIGRPVSVRAALARSRMVFWRAVVASIIVGIPVLIAQSVLDAIFTSAFGPAVDTSILSSTLAAILVGAPFAYLLTGIVLGDVDPLEATRRSYRVFRARKVAAAVVAVFETVAVLLIVFGLSAGLDIAQRAFDALGLGADSGPAGLTLITLGVIVGVFALGTLMYTAMAISIAPQVVMFVGLTRATMGLDHVRPGGDQDPIGAFRGRRRFRWLTRPMRIGFAFGILGLAMTLSLLSNWRG